jgi:hypothetical protein
MNPNPVTIADYFHNGLRQFVLDNFETYQHHFSGYDINSKDRDPLEIYSKLTEIIKKEEIEKD